MNAFSFNSPSQKIIGGAGSIACLGEETAVMGLSRGVVVCGSSVRSSLLFDQVAGALESAAIKIFDRVKAHSPIGSCRELAAQAANHAADHFVTIGGGSASDTAKIAAVLLAEGDYIERHASRFEPPDRFLPVTLQKSKLPIIAIPTTASAAENTFGAGVRMPDGDKLVVWDPKLAARLIILDPEAIRETPWDLLSSTAMNALAHCVEAIYSRLANPVSEALALHGARLLRTSLLGLSTSIRTERELLDLLVGANLSGLALSNARVCIHHAICHGLGGIGGLPHGVANTIILPHAMRFNAVAASQALTRLAAAFDVEPDGDAAIEAIRRLQQAIGAPTRLRDTTLQRELLPAIAEHTMRERGVHFNPRKIKNSSEVLGIIEAAW